MVNQPSAALVTARQRLSHAPHPPPAMATLHHCPMDDAIEQMYAAMARLIGINGGAITGLSGGLHIFNAAPSEQRSDGRAIARWYGRHFGIEYAGVAHSICICTRDLVKFGSHCQSIRSSADAF